MKNYMCPQTPKFRVFLGARQPDGRLVPAEGRPDRRSAAGPKFKTDGNCCLGTVYELIKCKTPVEIDIASHNRDFAALNGAQYCQVLD